MRRRTAAALSVVLTLMLVGPRWLTAGGQPSMSAILAAEAARARAPEQLELLRSAARTGTPAIQRAAIRALGRLERSTLVPDLVLLLNVADAQARAEAANAAAQAVGRDAAAAAIARPALIERLSGERDAEARGAMCEALGRLPAGSTSDAARVERLLVLETARVALRQNVTLGPASPLVGVSIGWGTSARTSTPSAVGALRGLVAMFRLAGKARSPSAETIARLRELAQVAVTPARRLALLALNAASAADPATIDGALGDDDVEVRRLAAAAPGASAVQLQRALGDRSPMVRYEALRAWGRLQAQDGCAPILASATDANVHVALLALDLLGSPCKPGEPALDVLKSAAGTDQGWHKRSHAVVALARMVPDAARPLLPGLLAADFWVARMYAARAAVSLDDVDALRRLAGDRDANVREAAIASLAQLVGHEGDPEYLRALEPADGQLLITAARALQGTPRREAATRALLSALERLTGADSDTARDPRLALLDRLLELGSRESAPALVPLLRDFDPRVAERAAAVLAAWTGEAPQASPERRPAQPVPTDEELARLSRSSVRVTMKGGARFDIGLMTDLAPLSCAAFARRAAGGYYDGLTVHRIVPNFVVQGGSPGANEYAGATRFMLDEVGRVTQSRGTVGTSTRGRDTGDGQFYVNLVDNPRLDHDYTIFGEVTNGLETVDALLEGDRIERVEVIPSKPRGR
jgi:cyclophilin family peptidyl-prolyl cis-trans isomerase/HEAT repeat protein